MKTTPTNPTKTGLLKSQILRITIHILNGVQVATKYAYWFLSVIIFFSCQKNLTRSTEPTATVQPNQAHVEKFVTIDTAEYALCAHDVPASDSATSRKVHEKMETFYATNSFKTKWMETSGPGPLYYTLIDYLKNAVYYGLNPAAYDIDGIARRVDAVYANKPASTRDMIDADIRITETFFLFAAHLRDGRITDPGHRGKIWVAQPGSANDADVNMLASVRHSTDLDEMISKLQPANDQYAKLQKQLVHYRTLEKSDIGQLRLSTREKIKPADKHVAIPAIRKKLRLMEIQTEGNEADDSLYYDAGLVSAVKEFQKRHGLEQDGIIGGKTITYLNQSWKEKADVIALNMERKRWTPEYDASQYIHVNIPEYKLRIYENGTRTLEMNVIVGAVSSATPVFTDTLEHVVLSPTWTVPPSIVKEEFLPRLRKNKLYYANRKEFTFYKNGAEIDPSTEDWENVSSVSQYRIVQKPGTSNALGLAKFVMPNDMNIYLHDTPDHKPFSSTYRALSHGCIRLDDPAQLAAYLLQNEAGWEMSKIKKAMKGGNPTKIALKKKYQVNLEYNTAWVDDDGKLFFGEDIYGHDRRHLEKLNAHRTVMNYNAVAAR